MPILVSVAGMGVAAVGLLGVAAPVPLARLLTRWRFVIGFPMTFGLRIVFGSVFLVAAPHCRLPMLVRLIGFAELGGAALLLALGAGRLGRFADWWLQRSPSFVRVWCLAAFAFGIVIVYAGR